MRIIIGKAVHKWQDSDYVLLQFGDKVGMARKEYRKFVEAGISQGHRPELAGGGLIRAQGDWSKAITMRSRKSADKTDERILGSVDFVDRIVAAAEERQGRLLTGASALSKVEETIKAICAEEGVNVTEVKGGSRRRQISRIRKRIAEEVVERYGVRMAIVARETGVTTTAISKLMAR